MKTYRLNRAGSLILLEEAEPEITSPTQVKIQMRYCILSGYDAELYSGQFAPPINAQIGLEGSGIIVETGSAVKELQKGNYVTFTKWRPCHSCRNCRLGKPDYCTNLKSNPGTFSEYVVCDEDSVYLLRSDQLKRGAALCSVSLALKATDKAALTSSSSLLLIGAGGIGQLILQIARTRTAASIVVVDPSPRMRELAIKLGADVTLAPEDLLEQALSRRGSLGYDAVIEASGKSDMAATAYSLLGRGGNLVLFGMYDSGYDLPVNLLNLYWKDASITSVYFPTNLCQRSLDLLDRLNLDSIISREMPFENAEEAFRLKTTGTPGHILLSF